MASFNRVILMGNITRDPELRYISSGMAVTDIGLAVNDKRKNAAGEWVDETTFVDVTLWGRSAEVACEYLKKGSSCFIEGRLKLDSWESNDGQKRSKLKVVGEVLRLLGGRGEGGGRSDRGSNAENDMGQRPAGRTGAGRSPGGRGQAGSYGGGQGSRESNFDDGYGPTSSYGPGPGRGNEQFDDFADGPGGAPQDDDIPF